MNIQMKEQGELIILAHDDKKPERHIFVYKVSPVGDCVGDCSAESIYVAVPNGNRVELSDFPSGSYVIEQIK